MAQTQSNLNREQPTPDQIRKDIRHTRSEMDGTLDELQDRLHPRRLLDDLLDMLKPSPGSGTSASNQISSQLKQTTKTVGRYARENPIPSLLMTAGVAWAIYDAANDDEEAYDAGPRVPEGQRVHERSQSKGGPGMKDRAAQAASSSASAVSSAGSRIGEAGSRMGETASSAASRASEATSASWQRTKGATRRSYRKAGELTGTASEYANQGLERSRQGLEQMRHRFTEASEHSPLAVAGGFLAAGLLAGLILPRTRTEDEWMGETSDEAWEQAKAQGEQLMEQGKETMTETASAVMEEAESQGLTPDQLSEKAKRVATKVGEAAKEATKEEGVDPKSLKEKGQQVGTEAKKKAETEAKKTAKSHQ